MSSEPTYPREVTDHTPGWKELVTWSHFEGRWPPWVPVEYDRYYAYVPAWVYCVFLHYIRLDQPWHEDARLTGEACRVCTCGALEAAWMLGGENALMALLPPVGDLSAPNV